MMAETIMPTIQSIRFNLTDFAKIAIAGGREGETSDFCMPCGVCRQVMAEFCDPDLILVLGKPGAHKEYRLSDVLPFIFTAKEL